MDGEPLFSVDIYHIQALEWHEHYKGVPGDYLTGLVGEVKDLVKVIYRSHFSKLVFTTPSRRVVITRYHEKENENV